jgi:DNA polymerase-3 subunit epsilon
MSKATIAQKCRNLLALQPLFLDTETTGLGLKDEVIDIAVISHDGQLLLNALVKPTVPLPPEVSAVNGITPTDLFLALDFRWIVPKLAEITKGKQVITYGAGFDVKMIRQTCIAHGLETPIPKGICAMILYSNFHGEVGQYGDCVYQNLEQAAAQCQIPINNKLHRAAADTDLLRQIFLHMATYHE